VPSSSPDIVILGGGVIGLSIAWHLLRADASLRVTVLEREPVSNDGAPGQASPAAAGMLAPLAEAHAPGPFARLALASLRRRGWVLLRTLGPRRGPPRLLYRATAAGRRELQRWLAEAPPPPRRNDAVLARIALLDALPPAARPGVLAGLGAVLEAEAARLETLGTGEGSRGLARRAAAAERRGLGLFLEGGGAPAAVPRSARSRPVSPQKPPRRRRRKYHR